MEKFKFMEFKVFLGNLSKRQIWISSTLLQNLKSFYDTNIYNLFHWTSSEIGMKKLWGEDVEGFPLFIKSSVIN